MASIGRDEGVREPIVAAKLRPRRRRREVKRGKLGRGAGRRGRGTDGRRTRPGLRSRWGWGAARRPEWGLGCGSVARQTRTLSSWSRRKASLYFCRRPLLHAWPTVRPRAQKFSHCKRPKPFEIKIVPIPFAIQPATVVLAFWISRLGFSTVATVSVLKRPSTAVLCDFSFWLPSLWLSFCRGSYILRLGSILGSPCALVKD